MVTSVERRLLLVLEPRAVAVVAPAAQRRAKRDPGRRVGVVAEAGEVDHRIASRPRSAAARPPRRRASRRRRPLARPCRCRRPAAAARRRCRGNARRLVPASPSNRWRFSAASIAALRRAELSSAAAASLPATGSDQRKIAVGRLSAKRICMDIPRKSDVIELSRSFRRRSAHGKRALGATRIVALGAKVQ